MRLVEMGGRTAQDLGFGRIAGQVLLYLYLWDGACSLDQIQQDLGLSKAAASVAARQLETLGLLRREWKQGDRRSYYRTADNLGTALRNGVVGLLRRKMEGAAAELDQAYALMHNHENGTDADLKFLASRVERAKELSDRATKILNSRILRYLVR